MSKASYGFKWLVWGLVVTILALGLLRMLWITKEDTEHSAVDVQKASIWALCLPSIVIDADSTIRLAGLADEVKKDQVLGNPKAPRIEYVATNDVIVDPIDPELNAALSTTGTVTLPKDAEIRIRKGEFWLTGNVEAQLSEGGKLVLQEPERLRLGPTEDQSYLVKLNEVVVLPQAQAGTNQRMLPAGTRGYLNLAANRGIEVTTLETTSGKPLLFNAPAKLIPIRAFGEKGPSAVSIVAENANLNVNSLAACAISEGKPFQASITDVSAGKAGASNLTVSLPSSVLPEWGWPAPIQIAIASSDGKFIAHGGLRAYPRLWGAIIASLLTAALFGSILKTRYMTTVPDAKDGTDWGRWFAGLFISDGDNDPSLSLFQVFFWTVITVWGLFYTYAVTGSLLQMTPQMLTLLGIAGTGSVLARWISLSRGESTSQPVSSAGASLSNSQDEPFRFWDILNTRGQFDLMKLQLLVFTLLLGVYVICRIAESAAFPVLDTNTLLLLGVSQGVYIGGKLGGTTPLARAQAVQIELNINSEVTTNLPVEIQNDEKSRDSLKADEERLEKEKSDLDASGGDPGRVSKKKAEIEQIKTSIARLEAMIKDKKTRLDAASKKEIELKKELDKIVKEDLQLKTG
ncbi:hypothetical protein ILFOPFJJ_04828 [Ensifer psoraleae]|uniref:hypothetical protein n=1 Tax=Sinorhizobium psoraleae TaxID=520838 RepID=UPI00156821E4|nr:hypothetical protein [Sinorhizobium psoraleae]NRP73910.1 hypothetical protein [Sinorhizobium psoraleae]